MRLIVIVLIAVLLILQYQLWFAKDSLRRMYHLRHSMTHQEKCNETLFNRNKKLISELQRLKNGKESMETLAREKLGMVKGDETYYQFIKPSENKT